jgi:rubrerythrin
MGSFCVGCRDLGDCLHAAAIYLNAVLRIIIGFAKRPPDILREKKFDSPEAADALRLAIIAELDAISLYLQLAKYVDDERVKKVFEDVAREEKVHFGEFLALLKTYDPGLAEGGR